MINTLLTGFFKVAMHVLDFFLTPIENLLYSSGLGDNLNSLYNSFFALMTNLRNILPWVVDATGIPKGVFRIIMLSFLACIGLRLSMFLLKLILKWWDRIIA